jgi:hypothetical protein
MRLCIQALNRVLKSTCQRESSPCDCGPRKCVSSHVSTFVNSFLCQPRGDRPIADGCMNSECDECGFSKLYKRCPIFETEGGQTTYVTVDVRQKVM